MTELIAALFMNLTNDTSSKCPVIENSLNNLQYVLTTECCVATGSDHVGETHKERLRNQNELQDFISKHVCISTC